MDTINIFVYILEYINYSFFFLFFFGNQKLQLELNKRVEAKPLKIHANRVIIQKHRHVHWGIIINPKVLILNNSFLRQKVCTLVCLPKVVSDLDSRHLLHEVLAVRNEHRVSSVNTSIPRHPASHNFSINLNLHCLHPH